MKEKSDRYHIRIKPEVLFNTNNNFKSAYSPWIYVYLRLRYNGYIDNNPNCFYKIDRKSICEFYGIDQATVSRAFKELEAVKLISMEGRACRLTSDLENENFVHKSGLLEFIPIYNNFFLDFMQRLKDICVKCEAEGRTMIKAAEVFYYIITRSRHIVTNVPIMESKDTIKSIVQGLQHDERYVKVYLDFLESIGQVDIGDDGLIKTAYGYGTCEPFEKKHRVNSSPFNISLQKEDEDIKESYSNEFDIKS